ncbi:glutamate receptor ionotropic, kainate 2-like [Centruroides vittatus]|uniref:glutamate receptor ionotropic, kainate 2-like n=1 Tax=Centruroides vittatus TaxID=120091 RepID=UPI00350FB124
MWRSSIALCIILCYYFHLTTSLPAIIKLGGLFDTKDEEQEWAFKTAIDDINNDKSILLPRTQLKAVVERIGPDDSFRATKKVCSLLQQGIAGIFGPQSDVTSMHVQAICDALDVPHVETRWDFQSQRDDLSINLFPRPSVLSRAYVDLVDGWKWTEFSLVYEEPEGIIRLQDFLKEAQRKRWKVNLYQFQPSEPYRDLFWSIKKEKNIILDVKRENIEIVLKHAQQVGMMTENHAYLITSLDFHTIDLEDFRYGYTNITGFRLVKTESQEYENLYKGLKRNRTNQSENIRTETALMYDAVKLFAMALQDLDASRTIDFPSISCENGVRGSDGTSIINYMKPISLQGSTGKVSFDSQGFRSSEFVLDILHLTKEGVVKIGHWTPEAGVHIVRHDVSHVFDYDRIRNKTLRVTTVQNDPYVMLKESIDTLKGNDRYEGFCIDLINKLAEDLNFNYEIHEAGDGQYGKKENDEWNGMIRELMDGKADVALVDLTITSSREEVVDFTMPFMTTGISILYKKSTTKVTTLFSFLSPFSMEVWVYVMGAYLGVSVTLFLVGRLSPYEWDNPHPCRQDDQVLENSFSLLNSMWFTIGSLMQQGSDVAPKAMSTRTIAGIWYFFTLIMISSYTANLAAFLTVENSVDPFTKAEDLVDQTEIKYGCVRSGSTKTFFEETQVPAYKKLGDVMKNNPDYLVDNNNHGVERVLQGNYAYFMESASIEYKKERECNLTNIGGLLDNKGYGIATQNGSHYRTILSNGILKLQEAGVLLQLRDRWWKQKRGGGRCSDESKKSSSNVNELGLGNVGGVFVVLLVGLGMATVVAILEFLWKARKQSATERESICKEMFRELKFALSCQSSTKPVHKKSVSENNDFRISGFTPEY